jgi:hypothetical protein
MDNPEKLATSGTHDEYKGTDVLKWTTAEVCKSLNFID